MTAPISKNPTEMYIVTYSVSEQEADPYKPGEYYSTEVQKYQMCTKDRLYKEYNESGRKNIKCYKAVEVHPKFDVIVNVEV